jgi:hypothetical protein
MKEAMKATLTQALCGVLLTFALTNEGGRVISVVASPFPKSTV